MSSDVVKTTVSQFKYFQSRCYYWQDRLSLGDWKLFFQHASHTEDEDCLAGCAWDIPGRAATIYFAPEWSKLSLPTQDNLNIVACHELCELLLAHLSTMAHHSDLKDFRVDETVHAIIRRLEKALIGR